MVTLRDGFLPVSDGIIAWIEVFEEDACQVLYEPTETEISKMCEEHGFDLEHTLQLIRIRDPHTHGFVFIADRYRKHLAEVRDGRL